MKKTSKITAIVCCIVFCLTVASFNVNARHHHGYHNSDLHKAASIVSIVTNSIIGINAITNPQRVIYTTPAYPASTTVVVPSTGTYYYTTPVYYRPKPIYRPRPAYRIPYRHHRKPHHKR